MTRRVLPAATAAIICLAATLGGCGDDALPSQVGDAGVDAADAGADTIADAADAGDDGDAADAGDAGDTTIVEPGPLFGYGCPVEGQATARVIDDAAVHMEGPNALGGVGDVLLMNDQAAFIITGVEQRRTYWYYGGIPVDAVALDGCAQAGPEMFDESAFIVGRADLATFEHSVLRGFRGERVDIVSDGADGGEARIRVTGTDDFFWLIELQLLGEAFVSGNPRPLTEPRGIEITVDYVLEPGDAALRAEVRLRNLEDSSKQLITGMVHFFADDTRTIYASRDQISFAGFGADLSLPWIVASSGYGAWGWAADGWTTATTNIAGVDAMIDGATFLNPPRIAPAGEDGDTVLNTFYFAVGGSDHHSAIQELLRVVPSPMAGIDIAPAPIAGRVVDATTGTGIDRATVDVEFQRGDGQWGAVDGFITDADGAFAGDFPAVEGVGPWRLTVRSAGRPTPDPLVFDAANAPLDAVIEVGAAGTIAYTITDGDGNPIPAKMALWRGDTMTHRRFATPGAGTWDVPPGTWELDVTRGIEYAPYSAEITVSPGQQATVDIVLERVVDTTGFLSMDGHVHSGPSPDSAVAIGDRLLSLAAENVEIPVSTDHEAIISWMPWLESSGVAGFVRPVLGSEITPPLPEHINGYPFPDRSDVAPRGDFVQWYNMNIAEIFAEIRARGAQVVSLNHPRYGCNLLCRIGYDRLTGLPTLDDPTLLGFEPDDVLWSWDFDTVEYQNGVRPVLVEPARPDETGLFEDWMSFQNLGHRITAVGVTDVHELDAHGLPRNFFQSPTDDPAAFEDSMLVDAMLGGRSLVSTGAFARVSIGEATMGDTATADAGSVTLSIHVEALEEIDVTHVTVFANCDEVATLAADDPYAIVKLDTELTIELDADAHIVVLGWGADLLPRNLPQFNPAGIPRFTTNPIFVDVDGDGAFTAPGGRACSYTIAAPKNDIVPRHMDRLVDLDGWLARRSAIMVDLSPSAVHDCH